MTDFGEILRKLYRWVESQINDKLLITNYKYLTYLLIMLASEALKQTSRVSDNRGVSPHGMQNTTAIHCLHVRPTAFEKF